ncbi:MAG: DUF1800 domain-containing protein [Panacagrimonas sp.]
MQRRKMSRGYLIRFGLALAVSVIGVSPAQAAISAAQIDAARLVTQATFGATRADIDRAVSLGNAAWVDEQLTRAPSLHLPPFQARVTEDNQYDLRHYIWWERSVKAPDQLRQRIAFALSEIMVVSEKSDIDQIGLSHYYDVLVRNALGNFRTLLEQVTLSPAMGRYLSMLGNPRPDPANGVRADENFARELMQLFTIGLWQLNLDGSRKLDSGGRPIPTYSQADIENLARIFTGWHWAGMSSFYDYDPNWVQSMQAYAGFHDINPKLFMGNSFPRGKNATKELKRALDILFNHPNVGPFVCRQLIQRLVTSNPSPAYISRVASRFNNNGQGVRGDLRAVVRAILLDTEARNGHTTSPQSFGKLREPLIRISHVWRAFRAPGIGSQGVFPFSYSDYEVAQGPLTSRSVFNFFSPNYSPPGALRQQGYLAPEMQLVNESLLTSTDNFMIYNVVFQYIGNPYSNPDDVRINLSYEKSLANNVPALIEHLNLVLMNGKMSTAQRDSLSAWVRRIEPGSYPEWDYDRAAEAIYLIVASPQYLVQK